MIPIQQAFLADENAFHIKPILTTISECFENNQVLWTAGQQGDSGQEFISTSPRISLKFQYDT